MKKTCISFLLIGIIFVIVMAGINTQSGSEEYLRIHIRANSNSNIDQDIKYIVKDEVVNFLTPYVAECDSKEKLVTMLNSNKEKIENVIDTLLYKYGFCYTSSVAIRNETFPTRVYENFTLYEGVYDAIIIELGKGEGDNWWCVVYPPLCFTSGSCDIKYKSKILEIIRNFKN